MADRDLTPAEDERVRRLLAQARHDEPLPADVAERLDAALRDLAQERATPPPVVDLAARRRRRRASGLLVAAAAVTVLAVGTPQLFGGLVAGGDDTTSTAGGSVSEDNARAPIPEAQSGGAKDLAGEGGQAPVPPDSAPAGAYSVRDQTFRRDVRRLLLDPSASTMATTDDPALRACRGSADWGEGVAYLVTYGDRSGALVYRDPVDARQRVDLFLCGASEVTRSTVVPLP
jgi:hypothetical protein